jgi:hypothetical protein
VLPLSFSPRLCWQLTLLMRSSLTTLFDSVTYPPPIPPSIPGCPTLLYLFCPRQLEILCSSIMFILFICLLCSLTNPIFLEWCHSTGYIEGTRECMCMNDSMSPSYTAFASHPS